VECAISLSIGNNRIGFGYANPFKCFGYEAASAFYFVIVEDSSSLLVICSVVDHKAASLIVSSSSVTALLFKRALFFKNECEFRYLKGFAFSVRN